MMVTGQAGSNSNLYQSQLFVGLVLQFLNATSFIYPSISARSWKAFQEAPQVHPQHQDSIEEMWCPWPEKKQVSLTGPGHQEKSKYFDFFFKRMQKVQDLFIFLLGGPLLSIRLINTKEDNLDSNEALG